MRLPLKVLEGGTVVQVGSIPGEPPDEPMQYLIVEVTTRGGKKVLYQAEAWRDPEGNGPGHLFIGRPGE